jgi:uncharacterized membrane protein
MSTGRLEAFSDGVIAVIITIMVLELKVPSGHDLRALAPSLPVFVAYVVSFIFVGIYWNNHHHLLHATDRIDGRSMWANLHLLFWLSLVPWATGWIGQNSTERLPSALYGFVLLMAAIAYTLLQQSLIACNGPESAVARATGTDFKGKISIVCCTVGIAAGFFVPWLADILYAVLASIWFVPDRRIERIERTEPRHDDATPEAV